MLESITAFITLIVFTIILLFMIPKYFMYFLGSISILIFIYNIFRLSTLIKKHIYNADELNQLAKANKFNFILSFILLILYITNIYIMVNNISFIWNTIITFFIIMFMIGLIVVTDDKPSVKSAKFRKTLEYYNFDKQIKIKVGSLKRNASIDISKNLIVFIDENNFSFRTFNIDEIIYVQILQNNESMDCSNPNDALIGYMVGGVKGALILDSSGKTEVKKNLGIKIILSNINNSVFVYPIASYSDLTNKEYNKLVDFTNEVYTTISMLINNKDNIKFKNEK